MRGLWKLKRLLHRTANYIFIALILFIGYILAKGINITGFVTELKELLS